jgi:hypothetical protein
VFHFEFFYLSYPPRRKERRTQSRFLKCQSSVAWLNAHFRPFWLSRGAPEVQGRIWGVPGNKDALQKHGQIALYLNDIKELFQIYKFFFSLLTCWKVKEFGHALNQTLYCEKQPFLWFSRASYLVAIFIKTCFRTFKHSKKITSAFIKHKLNLSLSLLNF